MKVKTGIFVLAILLALSLPQQASAHLVGQPPFFKINGEYSGLYQVPVSSTKFEIPQDLAPRNFTVGEKIDFEIDTAPLQIPKEVVDKSTFLWKYGDGTTGSGLKTSHIYQQPGSHILSIDVTYEEVPEPTLLQSVVIQVLPDPSYELPKAQIKVNGKTANDPLVDIFHLGFDQKVILEAQVEGANNNAQFLWDLGDEKTSTQQSVENTYPKNEDRTQYFPILRVTDNNGFFTDSYVQLSFGADNTKSQTGKSGEKMSAKIYIIPGILLLVIVGYLATRNKKKK